MAFPLARGITPPEIAFLAEMEQVTVVPRQRLEGLELLSVSERYRIEPSLHTQLTNSTSRDPSTLSCLLAAQLFPSGLPFSSNANVAQTSCLPPGYTPNLSP